VPEVEKTLGQEIFRCIPNSFSAVAESINQGIPILSLAPRDPVAKVLREMTENLVAVSKEGGWLRTLLPAR